MSLLTRAPSIHPSTKERRKDKKKKENQGIIFIFFPFTHSFYSHPHHNTSITKMANINLYFVRHGQRIDQIDSSWAATSPCPQDPPLTDQGCKQARQTGKMIRDFALEQSHHSNTTNPRSSQDATRNTCLQRITPPESPDFGGGPTSSNGSTGATGTTPSSSSSTRGHHFAIVTSPFLRCAQTAIEMAIGIRSDHHNEQDTTTIAVEAGIAGKFDLCPLFIECISFDACVNSIATVHLFFFGAFTL